MLGSAQSSDANNYFPLPTQLHFLIEMYFVF
jgi:hypothetical protein